MRIPNKEIRSILIIKNDKIGDLVLSTCIFRELKKFFPQSKITVIASNCNASLIQENPHINEIIIRDYPPKGFSGLLDYYKLSKKIKKQKFDLGIDLRGSIFNIFFFLALAKVKYKIGFYNRSLSKFLLDFAYKKDRENSHVTFQRINLINKALNLNAKNDWPDIHTSLSDKKETEEFIKKYKLRKFISILPDASLEKKQWPMQNWDALIKHIQRKYPRYQILLLGMDNSKLEKLKKNNLNVILPNSPLSLRYLYLLFQRSILTICHDGGPMHLAWAGKSKLLALMDENLPVDYVKPLGKNSQFIKTDIKTLKLGEVIKKVDSIL